MRRIALLTSLIPSMSAMPLVPSTAYRSDIDGLRAFAVLAVIFEHFGVPFFPGGYVGVDVFFVISGYLITSIILPQMEQGSFAFSQFYERRCRRLLPALYVMLFCVALVPPFMLSFPFPTEMYQSLGATLLFGANIFFGARQGYFDAASGEKPLLHMWSLGVEEQFYLIIPLFLMLLVRYRPSLLPHVLGGVLLASLTFSVVSVSGEPAHAFYWLPSRAWELCLGCLLAWSTMQHPPEQENTPQHWLSWCAVGLLIFPVLCYDRSTLFPAHMAVAPCVGAALCIYLGAYHPKSWIVQALSLRTVVCIGLLSYGLYLWHWPIWVVLQHLFVLPSSSQTGPTLLFTELGKGVPYLFVQFPFLKTCAQYPVLVASLFTVVCTLLSYWLIERPIRRKQILRNPRHFFAALVLGSLFLGGLSVAGQQGLLALRFGEKEGEARAGTYLAARQDKADTNARDIEAGSFAARGMPQLNPGSTEAERLLFVALGDSHYALLAPLFEEFFAAHTLHGQHSAHIRYPLLGLPDDTAWGRKETPLAYEYLRKQTPKHVLLSTRWVWRQSGDSPWAVPRDCPALDFSEFQQALELTAQSLTAQNIELWLVMPIPEMPFDVPSSLEATVRSGGDPRFVGISYDEYLARAGHVRDLFTALEVKYSEPSGQAGTVHVLDPAQVLCVKGFCRTEENGKSLYRDDNHLSAYGVQVVSGAFAPLFDALLEAKGDPHIAH